MCQTRLKLSRKVDECKPLPPPRLPVPVPWFTPLLLPTTAKCFDWSSAPLFACRPETVFLRASAAAAAAAAAASVQGLVHYEQTVMERFGQAKEEEEEEATILCSGTRGANSEGMSGRTLPPPPAPTTTRPPPQHCPGAISWASPRRSSAPSGARSRPSPHPNTRRLYKCNKKAKPGSLTRTATPLQAFRETRFSDWWSVDATRP